MWNQDQSGTGQTMAQPPGPKLAVKTLWKIQAIWNVTIRLMGTMTVVGLMFAGVLFLWEMVPTYLNRMEALKEQQAAPAADALAAATIPQQEQKPSVLFAEQPATQLPTASDIFGQVVANVEENAQRQAALIGGESEARLQGVTSMMRSREQMLDMEVQARILVLKTRLEETSRANGPNVMRSFFLEFGCIVESGFCPAADASTEQIVEFFDRHIMKNPKFQMIFSNEALQRVAGYDEATGTWDNGAKTYLADR